MNNFSIYFILNDRTEKPTPSALVWIISLSNVAIKNVLINSKKILRKTRWIFFCFLSLTKWVSHVRVWVHRRQMNLLAKWQFLLRQLEPIQRHKMTQNMKELYEKKIKFFSIKRLCISIFIVDIFSHIICSRPLAISGPYFPLFRPSLNIGLWIRCWGIKVSFLERSTDANLT